MGGFLSKAQAGRRRSWIFRHSAIVRVTHWINFLCLAVLLMSGLQIFNAHPALYWGQASDFQDPHWRCTRIPTSRALCVA
jgi:Ni,Fe-hydrogenase I cytochrome b subunit